MVIQSSIKRYIEPYRFDMPGTELNFGVCTVSWLMFSQRSCSRYKWSISRSSTVELSCLTWTRRQVDRAVSSVKTVKATIPYIENVQIGVPSKGTPNKKTPRCYFRYRTSSNGENSKTLVHYPGTVWNIFRSKTVLV